MDLRRPDARTTPELTLAATGRLLRGFLASVEDPGDELVASPGMRARIAAAATTLEAVAAYEAAAATSSTA